jgi:multicomponent Na+:H+ antiporter subunit D
VTFLLFYELLTVTTYPLIVHRGTDAARAGGRAYLLYAVGGGAVLLVGIAWLHGIAGPVEFGDTVALEALAGEQRAGRSPRSSAC